MILVHCTPTPPSLVSDMVLMNMYAFRRREHRTLMDMCAMGVEQVHYVQAGWYFRRGRHTLAARYYAKTPCCFEEIG